MIVQLHGSDVLSTYPDDLTDREALRACAQTRALEPGEYVATITGGGRGKRAWAVSVRQTRRGQAVACYKLDVTMLAPTPPAR